MKKKGTFLVTENHCYDILNIKHIACIEKGYNRSGTKIKMVNGSSSQLTETPDVVLEMIIKKGEK